MPENAREVAINVLRRVMADKAYSELALNAALRRTALVDADRALASELVYGVLRNRAYLDWRIRRLSRTPLEKMEWRVADALRLGAYQLIFLDRVPAYAAVDESVNLAPRRASGLVNAILRRLVRERQATPEPTAADPLEAAAIRWSHPAWLLREWEAMFGAGEALALAQAGQRPPPATLRVNLLRVTREALLARLADLAPEPTAYSPAGFTVARLEPALRHAAFEEGLFLVQGEAAQLVSELSGARPGERVLDLCAAPGGKSTHLAALVGPEGCVTAADVRPNRLRLLQANLRRLGAKNVGVRQLDASRPVNVAQAHGPYDRVLVDAPCTALGTLARHPEVKWQVVKSDATRLADAQLPILLHAAECVRPGGALLYAVCTLTRAETFGVVERFLAERGDFAPDDLRADFAPRYDAFLRDDGFFLSLPHRTGAEGMFAARFRRR